MEISQQLITSAHDLRATKFVVGDVTRCARRLPALTGDSHRRREVTVLMKKNIKVRHCSL